MICGGCIWFGFFKDHDQDHQRYEAMVMEEPKEIEQEKTVTFTVIGFQEMKGVDIYRVILKKSDKTLGIALTTRKDIEVGSQVSILRLGHFDGQMFDSMMFIK